MKMHISKFLFTFFVFLFCVFSLSAYSSIADYTDLYTASQFKSLLAGETLTADTTKSESTIKLSPKNTIMRNMTKDTQDLDYAFSVLSVTFIPYPETYKKMSSRELFLYVYNRLHQVSTLNGITYKSARSGGKGEVLFSEAYLLKDSNLKNGRIADPIFNDISKIMVQSTSYAYLKDSRFGGNIYELGYYAYKDEVFLELTNQNALKYMGISAVKAGNLHIYLDIVMAEEGFLISGLTVCYKQAPTVNILFTSVDLPSAFRKRVDSIKSWFIDGLR